MRPERSLDCELRSLAAAREAGDDLNCMPPPWIAELRPYRRGIPPEARDGADPGVVIKLDSNEGLNPPRHIIDKLIEFLQRPGAINHYPDEDCHALRCGLSAYIDQPANQIVPFCGADGALEAVARTFLAPGDGVILTAPCYDQFRAIVELAGARPRYVKPGASPLQFDRAAFLEGCRAAGFAKLIYLVNPNSPGGYAVDEDAIVETLTAFPNSLVVVDETYIEFAPHLRSAIPLLRQAENLIVVRSFSKAFGLAGLRLGFAVAPPRIADTLEKVRNGKAVTALAQVAGLAALGSRDHFRAQADANASDAQLVCPRACATAALPLTTRTPTSS